MKHSVIRAAIIGALGLLLCAGICLAISFQTNDGYYIQVINRALIHTPPGGKMAPYIRSVLDLEAPVKNPYDYLNHAVFLGTLAMPQHKPGEKPSVIIGVHRVL